ncbi:MAG: hypothetical protein U0411_00465 [Thermodesulfovibrionales bacterium]
MRIGENISVIASFSMPFRIKPVRFRWTGRLFEVQEITYTWKTREGQTEVYHFSVTDGKALYELTFDTRSLLWVLESLEA